MLETALVKESMDGVCDIFSNKKKKTFTLKEMAVGSKFIDIVVINIPIDFKYIKKNVTFREAMLITAIRKDRCRTIEELHNRTSILKQEIERRLTTLREMGVVGKRGNFFSLTKKYNQIKVITIEAKVSKIAEVLNQAKENMIISDYSCILVPQAAIDNQKKKILIRAVKGLGVIFSDKKQVFLAKKPQTNTGLGWQRDYIALRGLYHASSH